MELISTKHRAALKWDMDQIRVRPEQSFLRFVMPVAFPEQGRQGHQFEQRVGKIAASGKWELLKGESQAFLPHVRMHLNSVRWGQGRTDGNSQDGMPGLDPSVAFGYTFTDVGTGGLPLPHASFSFRVPNSQRRVAADITGAQLGIFRLGVGFVSLEISPRSDRLSDWLDALHFLRFYRGRGEPLLPVGHKARHDAADVLRAENFLGPLLAEATLDSEVLSFPAWSNGVRRGNGHRVREPYVPGELLTYVALFVDGVPEEEQQRLLHHVFYRFRSTAESEPGEEYDESNWCLPYQKDQQFLNSIQGSAFVAFDAPLTRFNTETLPSHLGTTYFVLFMLALLQRFALDQLSELVASSTGHVLDDTERSKARRELERVTALDSRLLDFTGRCYFVQVSQMEHHHRYYARLRDVNQIEDRYREVTEEVHALRAHASSRVSVEEERNSLRVGTALMVITCVLLPLQVIEALFSTKLPDLPGIRDLSPSWSAVTAGFVLLAASGIALLVVYGSRWERRRQDTTARDH
jgi:hypothetical protein